MSSSSGNLFSLASFYYLSFFSSISFCFTCHLIWDRKVQRKVLRPFVADRLQWSTAFLSFPAEIQAWGPENWNTHALLKNTRLLVSPPRVCQVLRAVTLLPVPVQRQQAATHTDPEPLIHAFIFQNVDHLHFVRFIAGTEELITYEHAVLMGFRPG